MARILIVDDHEHVRAGVRAMIAGEDDLTVVGEAAGGGEALKLCRHAQPELVLMDVRMPDMDGLAATRAVKQQFPGISVLILTMHDSQEYLLEAIKSGAAGYVLKDASQRELTTAMRKVLEGEVSLNRGLATQLIQRIAGEERDRQDHRGNATSALGEALPLTRRELEVMELMALGKTNREIAEAFVISVGTTKNHVEHIISKLGVSDRTQAVVMALKTGIIAFPER